MTPGCWLLVWSTLIFLSIPLYCMEWSLAVPSGCRPRCRSSFGCRARHGHGRVDVCCLAFSHQFGVLQVTLFRPSDIVIGGRRFYASYFFLLSTLGPHCTPCTELSQTLPCVWKWARSKTRLPKLWYPLHLKIRHSKISCFRRFLRTSQLNANFNGKYLWSETWYRASRNSVENYEGTPLSHSFVKFGSQITAELGRAVAVVKITSQVNGKPSFWGVATQKLLLQ